MGVRLGSAKAISAVSTWGLKHVFKRPAANFPGKIALYVDPRLIESLSSKLDKGSVVVCGTNGKTTVNNLLADVVEAAGYSVISNRTGANLDSGVATALLHGSESDWGVLESDELWLAKVLPQLKSDYLLLLNLFRDQLDRVGEINVIQDSITAALASSPDTTLIYNADDPLCALIAGNVANKTLAFGIDGSMGLSQNTVSDAQMCQVCSGMLEYSYRQYGQLGDYHCTTCDFKRPPLDFRAHDVVLSADGLTFDVDTPTGSFTVEADYSGAYMVYNLLGAFATARMMGCDAQAFSEALAAFDPQNGRLQRFTVAGRSILLNLAKNPTGFNQNLKLVLQDSEPQAVAFFINDKEADGRDISWLWDIDFEELAGHEKLRVFAGGVRRNDLQVRLKYAGLDAKQTDDASRVIEAITQSEPQAFEGSSTHSDTRYDLYLIANYTALPSVREQLIRMQDTEHEGSVS